MASVKKKKGKVVEQRSLSDYLSHLTLRQAEKLLGAEGKALLVESRTFEMESENEVSLSAQEFVLDLASGLAKVSIRLDDAKRGRLDLLCRDCGGEPCVHKALALSYILEEKMLLGLAAPPPERVSVDALEEDELVAQAISDREQRALTEKMKVKALDSSTPWTDYTVVSKLSGKTYRVALRGWEAGQMYCSCPDFRKNTLGLCKHTLNVCRKMRRKFSAKVCKEVWQADDFEVSVNYGKELSVHLQGPDRGKRKAATVVRGILGKELKTPREFRKLLKVVQELERLRERVTIYPDAEELMTRSLDRDQMVKRMDKIRQNPEQHPLRTGLLKADLLPYQLDGIAFAAGAGRAILADDMGLGKTIQGIGVARMLQREMDISRVLVICPASLKSQWATEIDKFSDLSSQLVVGNSDERAGQYASGAFFTICNYEQVLRDQIVIDPVPWDLIILDEGQRIKNWETKTSNVIKCLRSPYALVLTGTPLENRLDDLFSILDFVDGRRLGAAFRFYNQHRIEDESGRVLGYKNLTELRERLKPVLLRRTRATVLSDLPARTTQVIRIEPTQEQADYCAEQLRVISSIVNKKYLNEMDLLRLQKALLMARMAADSTYLVHRDPPGYSSKLERLRELLFELSQEEDRKIVLFSEWTTMLGLIEPLLEEFGMQYVRLDGSIPQKKRQALVAKFREEPECRVFITTNAGSTGLNLQAANTVINVDLPWNPAILEQRIARAHRMGQKRPVQVYILVTEDTIEENLLATLSAKHELAQAALDPDSDIDQVDMASGMEELKRRLEVLLGQAPDMAIDESERQRVEKQALELIARKEKVAAAGGELLSAAFGLLSEILPQSTVDEEVRKKTTAAVRENLSQCLETDDAGKTKLTVTLPDSGALDRLAEALGRLVSVG
ncbi:MAG: DEAD/DEAH box helicase [Verrucomicrobiales bacterium]|nr:DEAD/DEAH box helicase [Verrucomicrobiales bacterium]